MEYWKDVVGYGGLYQVSDQGQVRSIDRVVPNNNSSGARVVKGQRLRLHRSKKCGHLKITLSRNNQKKTRWIHQLVLEAFVGPRSVGMECCHNNGAPDDNRLSNLRWDTHQNNIRDKFTHGSGNSRPVLRSDGVKFSSLASAARNSGCKSRGIWRVCNNKRKTSGGFGWEYTTEKEKI